MIIPIYTPSQKGTYSDPFGAKLYNTVNKTVRRMAGKFYSILSDEDIDDLVHDTYVRLLENQEKADMEIMEREFEERFWKAINNLNPEYRKVAILLMEETPYQEMAKELGCTENTVKTKVCRTRQTLRQMGIAA